MNIEVEHSCLSALGMKKQTLNALFAARKFTDALTLFWHRTRRNTGTNVNLAAGMAMIDDMTVAEFIDLLKQFPQDLPLRIGYKKGAEIYVSDEFYDGDYANPNCPVIRALVVV